MVRQARIADLEQFGPPEFFVDINNVLVYEKNGRIYGVLCYWDGGHGRLILDGFSVAPDAPKKVGALLLRKAVQLAKQRGCTQVAGYTTVEKAEKYHALKGVSLMPHYVQVVYEV